MNIPFYRFVRYDDDDRVDIYQCLQCGEMMGVRSDGFYPLYCCFCGVKYKGSIWRKILEYTNPSYYRRLNFIIQKKFIWGREEKDYEWQDDIYEDYSSKHIIKQLKILKEKELYKQNKKEQLFETKYRIIMRQKQVSVKSIIIDVDKYFKKTGKKFDKKVKLKFFEK